MEARTKVPWRLPGKRDLHEECLRIRGNINSTTAGTTGVDEDDLENGRTDREREKKKRINNSVKFSSRSARR